MKQLDAYLKAEKALFDYFGYHEDWVKIPIDDARDYYWTLYLEEPVKDKEKFYDKDAAGGTVRFAETLKKLKDDAGDYYENDIYTQRFLPKWVYRGKDFTMICVDTHTDGNKFLQIFDNKKEVKDE